MKRVLHIRGAVLPTVMVVSVLLLLTVLAVASLWEYDYLFFSKHRHDIMQKAHIESGFALYGEYPGQIMRSLPADSTLLLYDSLEQSRIKIKRRPWGLYETVSVGGYDGKHNAAKIFGLKPEHADKALFYYRNSRSALTLTGKTNLKGPVRMPRNGVIYGQMGSVFFSGEKIGAGLIKESDAELPEPEEESLSVIRELMDLRERGSGPLREDSVGHSFLAGEPLVFTAGENLENIRLSGNVVITGRKIEIGGSCRLADVIVVGSEIRIKDGFKGSLQAFAADSISVGNNVELQYPSGLYSPKHISIGDGSSVNGYVIVDAEGKPDPRKANYRQSRLSAVRGLLYVSGTAQLQGIVSGTVFLGKAVYYSDRGYYENMIYDATVLENSRTAWPLWLSGPEERKEIKWAE